MTDITLDDVNVRINVTLGMSITVGLYAGEVTNAVIGEHVKSLLADGDIDDFLENVEIAAIVTDDEKPLVNATRSGED